MRAFPKREKRFLDPDSGTMHVYITTKIENILFLPENRLSKGNFMRGIVCAQNFFKDPDPCHFDHLILSSTVFSIMSFHSSLCQKSEI